MTAEIEPLAAPQRPQPVPDWLTLADEDNLAARLGIRLDAVSAQRVTGSMPVDGNRQLHRLLHGGSSAAFAETLGSAGAAVHAGPGRVALGVELSVSHHRAAHHGRVTGEATALYLGDALATYEIVVRDQAGRRLSTARLTCTIHNRRGRR